MLLKFNSIRVSSRRNVAHNILCYRVWLVISFICTTAMAIWDAMQKKYRILSETRLYALELKLSKLKCSNKKGIEKYLLPSAQSSRNYSMLIDPTQMIENGSLCLTHFSIMLTGNKCIFMECMITTLMISAWLLWN